MLLHSCPDTVHRFPLRKTQTSTPLTQGSFAANSPRQGITPAGADCRYRAPLSPRLRGNFMTYLAVHTQMCQQMPAWAVVENCLLSITCRDAFVKAVPPPKITWTDNLPGAPGWSAHRWHRLKESGPRS